MGFFVKSNESISEKNFFEFLLNNKSVEYMKTEDNLTVAMDSKMITDEIFCEIEIRFTILHFKFKEM